MGGRCVGRIKAWETINLSAREIKAAASIQAGCTTQEMANNLTPHSDRNCRGFLLQKRACHKHKNHLLTRSPLQVSYCPTTRAPEGIAFGRLQRGRLHHSAHALSLSPSLHTLLSLSLASSPSSSTRSSACPREPVTITASIIEFPVSAGPP